MATRISTRRARVRMTTGDAVLSNAQALDMTAVKDNFAAFVEIQRSYGKAQRKVEAAEQALAAENKRMAALNADQGDAVEAVALCLANDGEPRLNPLANFSDRGPGRMKALPPGNAAKAVQTLVTALQRNKSLSPATQRAVRTAEQAAQAVETALPGLETRCNELRAARTFRDTVARKWDAHFSALRLAARGVAATTVPDFDTALFGGTARAAKKSRTKTPAASPPAETPPATNASPDPSPVAAKPA